jgi:hypothetical protein
MQNITHRKIYQQFVNQENLTKLRQILDENLGDMGYELCKFDVLMDDDLPYIFCTIKSEEIFCAQMIGLIIDSDELEPKYTRPVYYLPAILMRNDFQEDTDGLLKKDRILQHELRHVHDILSYIEKYPDFPENYRKFGMSGDVSIEDLPKSMDMELSKLFFLEPAASKLDYNNGETYILINLDDTFNGKLGCYHCRDINEYVGLQMKSNLYRIRMRYQMKYPNDKMASKFIEQELNKALNKYGKDVFGQNPVQGLKDLEKRTSVPIMFAMAKANKRADQEQ